MSPVEDFILTPTSLGAPASPSPFKGGLIELLEPGLYSIVMEMWKEEEDLATSMTRIWIGRPDTIHLFAVRPPPSPPLLAKPDF